RCARTPRHGARLMRTLPLLAAALAVTGAPSPARAAAPLSCAAGLPGARALPSPAGTIVGRWSAGQPRVGVVLSDDSDLGPCSWKPLVRPLLAGGARVVLYDYGAGDPVAEATAAATALRRSGAARVVLVGASEGAKVSLVAESRRPGLADAIVS